MPKMNLRIVDFKRFEQDTQRSKQLVDELSAAALSLTSGGPMGYSNFIQTRDDFYKHIDSVARSYKTVEVE